MKTFVTLSLITATLMAAVPAIAAAPQGTAFAAGALVDGTFPGNDEIERRRPRVPGGSGCDSPRDLIEHPECRR